MKSMYPNLIRNEMLIPFQKKKGKNRKPVRSPKKIDIILKQKGKCFWCRKPIPSGVKPHVHHRNGNPSDNRDKNLIVLCPNCHSKAHEYKTITKKNQFGQPYKTTKLIGKPIRVRKKKRVKKRTKKRQTRNQGLSLSYSPEAIKRQIRKRRQEEIKRETRISIPRI